MAMLEGEASLTLDVLNQATQAWVEQEYHRHFHSELEATPLQRYLAKSTVLVNPDLILIVSSTPDTTIAFTTGEHLMVRESKEELANNILGFRRSVMAGLLLGSPPNAQP